MPNVCVNCVRDEHLKSLIEREGQIETCSNCGDTGKCLNTEEHNFFQLIKALVRYHFSEWEYNEHWGGVGYESLFYDDENIFFDSSRSHSEEAYDDIVTSISSGNVYEDYDKGVSVFAGYGEEGVPNMLLAAIKSDLDSSLVSISHDLRSKNHFHLEEKMRSVCSHYADVARINLSKGLSLFRAHVGFNDKRRARSMGFEVDYQYVPYTGNDISAPPPYLASAGRVNRAGVSFLYCATDEYTAVAEVRPHPADHVSIAKIKVRDDIEVFDLSDSKLLSFYHSDQELDEYRQLNTLGAMLNRTIPPSERNEYSITQLIADSIRQLGFDGILFNSTVGSGKNIVLFDADVVEQVPDAYSVVQIDKVKYEYVAQPLVNEEDDFE